LSLETDTHGSQESKDLGIVIAQMELSTESLVLHEGEHALAPGIVGKNTETLWLQTVEMAQAERADEEVERMMSQRRGSYVQGSQQVSL
jgi:hypothetical protein